MYHYTLILQGIIIYGNNVIINREKLQGIGIYLDPLCSLYARADAEATSLSRSQSADHYIYPVITGHLYGHCTQRLAHACCPRRDIMSRKGTII